MTNTIQKEKIVYDTSIVASIDSEGTLPTAESLYNIYQMLQSTDEQTIGTALRSLSSMNYFHCPDTVRWLLTKTKWSFCYNKAVSATSVKYMLKTLIDWRGRHTGFSPIRSIEKHDWEILKELMQKLEINLLNETMLACVHASPDGTYTIKFKE